jgi:hypothetical protein
MHQLTLASLHNSGEQYLRSSNPIIRPNIAVAIAYIDNANNVLKTPITTNQAEAQNKPTTVASLVQK